MPRKKEKKGVMEGFPKMAFYIGPPGKLIYIPEDGVAWYKYDYHLGAEELVVLVASSIKYDYTQRIPNSYNYKQIPQFYFVPVKVLEENRTPITCIYKWRVNYIKLPIFDQKLFTIIEKHGTGNNQTAIAA